MAYRQARPVVGRRAAGMELVRWRGTPWSPLVLADRALLKVLGPCAQDGVSQRVPLFVCVFWKRNKEESVDKSCGVFFWERRLRWRGDAGRAFVRAQHAREDGARWTRAVKAAHGAPLYIWIYGRKR